MNRFEDHFDDFTEAGDKRKIEVDDLTIVATIIRDDVYKIDFDEINHPLEIRRAWFRDEWFYCGVVLSVSKNDIVLDKFAASLWGIECNYPGENNNYLLEVANHLLPEAVQHGKEILQTLCCNEVENEELQNLKKKVNDFLENINNPSRQDLLHEIIAKFVMEFEK